MKNKKFHLIIYIVTIISFIGILFVYPKLPDKIPTHWNINGHIDSYSSKNMIFLLGSLPFFLALLFQIMPKLDPKKESYSKHIKAYEATQIGVISLLIFLDWFTIFVSFGASLNIKYFLFPVMGILFLIVGNYMPTVKSNYFFGIRNPWTLANEIVWKKTHKIGGYVFIICGILFILSAFLPSMFIMLPIVFIILGILIFINAYSYLLFKKITNQ